MDQLTFNYGRILIANSCFQTQNIYQQQLSLPTPQQQPPPPLMHQYSNQLGSRALVDSNQLGSRALVDSNQQQQSNQTQLMANLAALAGLAGPQSNPMWAPQSGPFQDNTGKHPSPFFLLFDRKGALAVKGITFRVPTKKSQLIHGLLNRWTSHWAF